MGLEDRWTGRQVIGTDYRGLGFLLRRHRALGLFTQNKADTMKHTCDPSIPDLVVAVDPAVS